MTDEQIASKRGIAFSRGALWLIPLIATSVVTLFVKDLWDAPRPRIELLSLELRSTVPKDAQLTLGPEMDSRIRQHSYLPNLSEKATLADVSEAIDSARESTQLHKRIVVTLTDLVTLVGTQSTDRSKAQRRREFIAKLTDHRPEWEIIERQMKIMTDSLSLPPVYASHPEGEKRLRVDLVHSTFDLSEIDPESEARRAATISPDVNTFPLVYLEAERTNKLRRILVYYDPDVVIAFLGEVKKVVQGSINDAEDIGGALESLVASARQELVTVKVLVSNGGNKALALRPEGVLKLTVPASEDPLCQRG